MAAAKQKDHDTSSFAAGVTNGAGPIIGGVVAAAGLVVHNHTKDILAEIFHNAPFIAASALAVGTGTILVNEYVVKTLKDKWNGPLNLGIYRVGNGAELQLLDLAEYRLLRQMERAFVRSHLEEIYLIRNSRISVIANCKNIDSDVIKFTSDTEHIFEPVSSGSALYDANALATFTSALIRSGPIYVKCLADQPAIIATLFYMKHNYKLSNLYIEYTEPSGFKHVNDIKGRVLGNRPFDYVFVSNADLLMGRSKASLPLKLQDDYRLVMPVYKTKGYVVRPASARNFRGMDGVEQIRYVPYGTSDELRSRTVKLNDKAYAEVPIASNEAQLIDKRAPWNEATLLWEHSYVPLKAAGKVFSVTDMEYEYWISMFSQRQKVNGQLLDIAFAGAFIQAWLKCKYDFQKTKHILREINLLPSFQSAMLSKYEH